MKVVFASLLLAVALSSVSAAQTREDDKIIIDGNQTLEVGGVKLERGTLTAGSLVIRDIDRIEIADDGVRIQRAGMEPMFFPTRNKSSDSRTLKDGLEALNESLGY